MPVRRYYCHAAGGQDGWRFSGGDVDDACSAALFVVDDLVHDAQGEDVALFIFVDGIDAEDQVVAHKVPGMRDQFVTRCTQLQACDDLFLYLCGGGCGQGMDGQSCTGISAGADAA